MADDSTRIGSSRVSLPNIGPTRKVSGTGGPSFADVYLPSDSGSVSVGGDQPRHTNPGAFGPRGNRILPASFPLDQLDRRAARGTYLDILV